MSDGLSLVVTAALEQGRKLRAAGQYSTALAVFAAMLDRLDIGTGPSAGRAVWRPAEDMVAAVRFEGRDSDWAGLSGLVTSGDPVLCGVVARALLNAGDCLDKTERRNVAINVYREVADRFGTSISPALQKCVAPALWRIALILKKEGRTEEATEALNALIVQSGDAADPLQRHLVSAAMGQKAAGLTGAGQHDAAMSVHRELVARRDEGLHPSLAAQTATSLLLIAGELARASRSTDTIEVLDDLLARFPQPDTERLKSRVASALLLKGVALTDLGENQQALMVFDELITRFESESSAAIRRWVVDAMVNKGAILEQDGADLRAAEVMDQTLSYLAGFEEPELVRRRIQILAGKAVSLNQAGREDEQLIVHDNLVAAYLALEPERRDQQTLNQVIWSHLVRARVVDDLHPRTSALVDQLVVILGDVAEPEQPSGRSDREPELPPEAEIAGLLADLYERPFWFEFATSTTDPASLTAMQDTALGLFARTANWMELCGKDQDTPAFAAAMIIRQIADGYALLAHPWTAEQRARLNLPLAIAVEWAVKAQRLDQWAEERGHRFELPDSQQFAEELIDQGTQRLQSTEVDVAAIVMVSVRRYEMLLAFANSATGQTALKASQVQALIDGELDPARTFAGYLASQNQDAAGVGVICVLIAEAFFVASRTPVTSSQELFPSPAFLRELLTRTDAYTWIHEQDIELPDLIADH